MALSKPAGTWTYEDLFDLPDDGRRWEIIDGELYEMPGPNMDHAAVIMDLIARFLPVVTALGGRIFTAPVDVFFAAANPVEPDIMVLLPDSLKLIVKRGLEGPPDLLVEVISPSNPRHDRLTKRALYARGGVREYWLVDPEAAVLEILVLDGGAYRTHVRAVGDDSVTSTVLPGLSFPASAVFAATLGG